MQQLNYGVAYYDEYMPYERLDQDLGVLDGSQTHGGAPLVADVRAR